MCMGCEHKNPEVRALYLPKFDFGMQSFFTKDRAQCTIAHKECPYTTAVVYWPDGEWMYKEDYDNMEDEELRSYGDDCAVLHCYGSSDDAIYFAVQSIMEAPFLKESDLGTEEDGAFMPQQGDVVNALMGIAQEVKEDN